MEVKVIESKVQLLSPGDELFKGHGFCRILVRTSLTKDTVNICVDSGCGTPLVSRDFLAKTEHPVQELDPENGTWTNGLGGGQRANKWATFWLYLAGEDRTGEEVIAKIKAGAWVLNELKPNMLLGNAFLVPNGADLLLSEYRLVLNQLDGFSMPVSVNREGNPVVKKVGATNNVTIPPNSDIMVPAHWTELPSGRDYHFFASSTTAYSIKER